MAFMLVFSKVNKNRKKKIKREKNTKYLKL